MYLFIYMTSGSSEPNIIQECVLQTVRIDEIDFSVKFSTGRAFCIDILLRKMLDKLKEYGCQARLLKEDRKSQDRIEFFEE